MGILDLTDLSGSPAKAYTLAVGLFALRRLARLVLQSLVQIFQKPINNIFVDNSFVV